MDHENDILIMNREEFKEKTQEVMTQAVRKLSTTLKLDSDTSRAFMMFMSSVSIALEAKLYDDVNVYDGGGGINGR